MAVELKVVLVGDDPQQKEALAAPGEHVGTAAPGEPASAASRQVFDSIDDLIKKIGELIEVEKGTRKEKPTKAPETKAVSRVEELIDAFADKVTAAIDLLGGRNTDTGRRVRAFSETARARLKVGVRAL